MEKKLDEQYRFGRYLEYFLLDSIQITARTRSSQQDTSTTLPKLYRLRVLLAEALEDLPVDGELLVLHLLCLFLTHFWQLRLRDVKALDQQV